MQRELAAFLEERGEAPGEGAASATAALRGVLPLGTTAAAGAPSGDASAAGEAVTVICN
jgi:RNA recognition motif-containing protein